MATTIEWIIDRIVENPRQIAMALLLFSLLVGHRAFFLVQDNSPNTFYAVNKQAEKTYRELIKTFESDELIMISLVGAEVNAKDLKAINALARSMKEIKGIKGILSPADIFCHLVEPSDELIVQKVKDEFRAISFYRELGLYRKDSPALSVLASVVANGPLARPEITVSLEKIGQRFNNQGYKVQIIGLTATHAAIDQETKRGTTFFTPLVFLIAGLMGLIIFRSPKAVLAILIPVSLSAMIAVGILELLGETMNLVSALIPTLVMVISCAGAVHLVSYYGYCSIKEGIKPERVRKTIKVKFVPTAFAFVTTAIGFASLTISNVHSVSVLGLVSAISLLLPW